VYPFPFSWSATGDRRVQQWIDSLLAAGLSEATDRETVEDLGHIVVLEDWPILKVERPVVILVSTDFLDLSGLSEVSDKETVEDVGQIVTLEAWLLERVPRAMDREWAEFVVTSGLSEVSDKETVEDVGVATVSETWLLERLSSVLDREWAESVVTTGLSEVSDEVIVEDLGEIVTTEVWLADVTSSGAPPTLTQAWDASTCHEPTTTPTYRVELHWTNGDASVATEVWRRAGDPWQQVATVVAGATAHLDSTVPGPGSYEYRLRHSGQSEFSNIRDVVVYNPCLF
jgi:hypothetical protein